MSESRNKERLNTVFHEAKVRDLPDATVDVDPRGNFTLTWLAGFDEITVVFTLVSLYLTVTAANGDQTIDFNIDGMTDAEVIDRVEKEIAKAAA